MKVGITQLLFVLMIFGLLGVFYIFVIKPGAEKRVAQQTEIETKRKALADLKQSTAGISDLERKIEELQTAIKFFESKLPQEKETDKILKEVWQLAEANKLQTKTVKTMKIERSAGYGELPIQMSLSGDFNGFYVFLQHLEKLARINRVNQLKLEKITSRDGEMQAQMTLSIFFESGAAGMAAAH